ncbi:hypothetical protein ElyMa_001196600 [Elysia marginata]|uniref:Uncharacterized protein n=1 Tax=Elysia marginata TaxID=1093978 RepID=A0AAV4I8C6_9GAST|nr:hypothetical protein ElyMa_001196600 [Elysia marginata]
MQDQGLSEVSNITRPAPIALRQEVNSSWCHRAGKEEEEEDEEDGGGGEEHEEQKEEEEEEEHRQFR